MNLYIVWSYIAIHTQYSPSLSLSPSLPLPVEVSHKKQPQRKFFRDDDSDESD